MSLPEVQTYPFPHFVMDGFWDPDELNAVLAEFPAVNSGWRQFANERERKFEGGPHMWGPRTRDFFENRLRPLCEPLGEAFGIPDLTMETVGGGYHLIPPGGLLAMHTDFTVSPDTHRYRRLNFLTYLNEEWESHEGGDLQLWDSDGLVERVYPEFNRVVCFETSDHSWHGHPVPTTRWRASIAAYFFSEIEPPGFTGDKDTQWHPRAS